MFNAFFILATDVMCLICQVPLRRLVFSLVRLLGQNCQMQDVLQLSTNYGSSCIHLTSELYQIVNSMISGNGEKGKVLSIIFGTLKLDWLAARLADLFICTYDISSIRGTARQLLRKPLSLEKIVRLSLLRHHSYSLFLLFCCLHCNQCRFISFVCDVNLSIALIRVKLFERSELTSLGRLPQKRFY